MPGWVRRVDAAGDDSGTGASAAGGIPPETPDCAMGSTQASRPPMAPARASLSQGQRDELIAEVLGDVLALSEQVKQLSLQMQAVGEALTANDFVRWRNTLDLKMSELAEVNLSEQSAKRLASFAQTYIEQLSRETNTMVTLQVKRAVSDTLTFNLLFDKLNREWLIRLGMICLAAFVGTFLANLASSL